MSLGPAAAAPAASKPASRTASRPGSAKGGPGGTSRGGSRPGSGGGERTQMPIPQGVSGVTVTSRPGSAARQQPQPQPAQSDEAMVGAAGADGVPPTPNGTPMK